MTYFVTDACVDVLDQSCVEECPVDCIYEGKRRTYINPVQCIDCDNCMQVCPVDAIGNDSVLTEEVAAGLAENAQFFTIILPGRTEPLGVPRGALHVGPVGADIPRLEEG